MMSLSPPALLPPVESGGMEDVKEAVEPAAQSAGKEREIDSPTLRAAAEGQPAALERFVRHYERLVFAFLSRARGSGGRRGMEVEDLAQEVFLRACRALPRYEKRETARTSTWLLTIATRLVLDERKRRRLPIASVDVERELEGEGTPELERRRQLLGLAIERAAAELPEEQRLTFVLVELHGLSLEEVAEMTQTRAATAKTRLFRARAHLRERLAALREEP